VYVSRVFLSHSNRDNLQALALKVWLEQVEPGLASEYIERLEFSADGHRLLSSSGDGTLRMWPVPVASEDALCAKITHNMSRQQWDARVSPDIDYVASCLAQTTPASCSTGGRDSRYACHTEQLRGVR
jgi:WD40 repeat protein